MPKKQDAPSGPVQVRLLCDSHLGRCDQVVSVDAADVDELKALGLMDDDASAVAYALSLVSERG